MLGYSDSFSRCSLNIADHLPAAAAAALMTATSNAISPSTAATASWFEYAALLLLPLLFEYAALLLLPLLLPVLQQSLFLVMLAAPHRHCRGCKAYT